jgi:ABC-type sugar transport system permease subunit
MTATIRARRWRGWSAQNSNPILGLAMIVPATVALALFQFLPLITAMLNSLQSFSPFDQSSTGWVGLDNYAELFADPSFLSALVNTFLYIVLMLGLNIPLALILAVMLDRRLPGSVWARNAIIGALAASEAVTALVWNQMYEPSSGLFNAILSAVHLAPQPFLTSSNQALVSIVIMSVWKDVGLPMLIFLAGLQAIPREIPEAAELDGANERQIFWTITLPMLRPSIVVALFMMTITATRMFTPILIMTMGGPQGSTTNLALYSYLLGFEFQSPGLASASVVCMLAVLVLITISQGFILRDKEAE